MIDSMNISTDPSPRHSRKYLKEVHPQHIAVCQQLIKSCLAVLKSIEGRVDLRELLLVTYCPCQLSINSFNSRVSWIIALDVPMGSRIRSALD